jgi:hypothetical protein
MLLIRYLLICLIVYLIVRSFVRYHANERAAAGDHEEKNKVKSRSVSKEIGEYIDFEEVEKKEKKN